MSTFVEIIPVFGRKNAKIKCLSNTGAWNI